MTQSGHWSAFHAAMAKPILAPFKVLARVDTMPSPEPEGTHAAAGISWCSG
jgi:hypothetical protein